MSTSAAERMKTLVAQLVDANRAAVSENLVDAIVLAAGATEETLAKLEAHLGRSLPPSLRALLAITDGAPALFVFSDFLSVRDMLPGTTAHARALALKATRVDGAPIIPEAALVFADKRGDQPDCMYLDPAHPNAEGDWRVVVWRHDSDDTVYPDLFALMEHSLARFVSMRQEADALGDELDALDDLA